MKKIYKIKVNSKVYEVELQEVSEVEGNITTTQSTQPSPTVQPVTTSGAGEQITAPMPGAIVDIKVTQGTQVQQGQVVAVLEAMKMETEILASVSGSVTSIGVAKGDQVNLGDTIITIN